MDDSGFNIGMGILIIIMNVLPIVLIVGAVIAFGGYSFRKKKKKELSSAVKDSSILAELLGKTGILRLYENRVEITRSGRTNLLVSFATNTATGDKIYFYGDIKSIEFKKPTMVSMGLGWFKFITGDGSYQRRDSLGNNLGPMEDPNAFVFQNSSLEDAVKIYEMLMNKISQSKQSNSSVIVQQTSGADELAK
ncbi:MAG: hypothetical protein LBS21_00865 [Clostridiales bacterium]|nr:hypothetical protein [Clostridiales bacterium]